MKKLLYAIIPMVMLSMAMGGIAQAIEVTQTDDFATLAGALGDDITITSVTGAPPQFGTFTNASGLWGIGSGIVLSSGEVRDYSDRPNTSGFYSADFGGAGQADLDGLIPGYTTYDAATVQFTFVAQQNQIGFNFVFGSEEYDEYVGTEFNDVFGAFFGGAGGVNVSFDQFGNRISINNAWMYGGNFPVDVTGTELDGATVLLRTVYGGLTPDETYSFMFGIADAGDHIYDSTVYISGFSGTSGETEDTSPVPIPATLWLLAPGLAGIAAVRRRFTK